MLSCTFRLVLTAILVFGLVGNSHAQRAGDSATIRTGTVTQARAVDLNDGNALGGALVGGAVGAALTRSKKGSSRRDRNALVGAVVGASAAGSKRRPGTIYTVAMPDGSTVQVATEQTEIKVDDCVHVEQTGNGTNIRRAAAAACTPDTRALLDEPDIAAELQEEAAECAVAKQELVDAGSDEAMERAIRKVQILCYN